MGIKERKEREKANRKRTILKTARKLFFKKGLENTTMDEIAAKAELSKGTIYLYYPSKEFLAISIIKESSDLLISKLKKAINTEKNGRDKMIGAIEALMLFFKENRNEFKFFRYMDTITSSIGTDNSLIENWKSSIEDIVELMLEIVVEGMKDGSIRNDLEPKKTAFIYSNMIMSFLIRLASHQGIILMSESIPEDEIIQTMFSMLIKILEPEGKDT